MASNSNKRQKLELQVGDGQNESLPLEDAGECAVVNEAISITLISTEIFRHLSHQDLLNCSLVNKFWNTSARFALREDRQTLISIGEFNKKEACKDLQKFVNDIASTSWCLPYNGLFIQNSNIPKRHRCPAGHLYEPLLAGIKIKNLRIAINCQPKYGCPAFKLVTQIFTDPQLSKNLVKLDLHQLPFNIDRYAEYEFDLNCDREYLKGSFCFPSLKLLDLPRDVNSWGFFSSPNVTFEQLLQASPQLQELKGYIPLDFLPAVIRHKKIGALHEFDFETSVYDRRDTAFSSIRLTAPANIMYDEDNLLDCALALAQAEILPLRRLSINTSSFARVVENYSGPNINSTPEKVQFIQQVAAKARPILNKILAKSKFIQELRITTVDLNSVLFHEVQLKRLTHFTIECISVAEAVSSLRSAAEQEYGFRTFGPVLKSIHIYCNVQSIFDSNHYLGAPFMPMDNFFEVLEEDMKCLTVTELKVTDSVDFSDQIHDLVELLPNVTHLSLDLGNCDYLWAECHDLWKAWLGLESLQLNNVKDSALVKNYDSFFTGLSNHLCEYFLGLKSKAWAKWDVKHVMKLREGPSLTNLSRLKRLQINVHRSHSICCTAGADSTLRNDFLSKLTGRVVFRQMPEFSVHIRRNLCDRYSSNSCRLRFPHLQEFIQFEDLD